MTLELRKYRIIKSITESTDEKIVGQIESIIEGINSSTELLNKLSSSTKEKLDLDKLMKEQNYVHPTKEELEQIIEDAAIEEPIEELLKMI